MQTKCLSKLSVNPIGYQTDIYDAADFDQYYDPDSEGKNIRKCGETRGCLSMG